MVANKVDDKTTYVWTRTNAANETVVIEGATSAEYDPHNGIDFDEGKYQVTLSNFKNNKVENKASGVCLVLNPIAIIDMNLADVGKGRIEPSFTRDLQDYEVRSYKWVSVDDLSTVLSTEEVFTATVAGTYELQCTIAKGSQTVVLSDTKRVVL